MRVYVFAMRKPSAETEVLGPVALRDDADALSFGKQVVRDLIERGSKDHAGWILDITDGERVVGSTPCKIEDA